MSSAAKTTARRRPALPALATSEKWLLVALALGFAPAVLAMAEVWDSVDYASHGYLVPVVAAWAAVRDAPRLRGLAHGVDPRGLWGLVLSTALYALGLALGLVELQGVAFVAALASAVLWRRGARWLRALAFPLGFLLFMVPRPDGLVAPVILRLRLFVTEVAVSILHGFDIAVAREGNVLLLPGGESLFVADACSGITSIVTLTPLAVLLAYFTERRFARRIALVLCVVPIALTGNLLRVVATVIAARHVGVSAATRSGLHDGAGLATYVLGCLALLAAGAVLRRLWPER
jgi:exosortase